MVTKLTISILALGISFAASADLTNIGSYDQQGIYQPGYTNYAHAKERAFGKATPQTDSKQQANIGYAEPNYVNYRAKHSSKGPTLTRQQQLTNIGQYRHGAYEPSYLNRSGNN
ncbi:hypothetical protein A3K86_19455 [Photobacterium jeanii]|uniref:Uncharacterized protein n=1 Tax=Photobacterium jeanii TaxID=858640 RepID=A0A178K337_9GAMM|nr:hypothetical protein [Photobacterium jeanii]OAN11144.1 hypothetical protein A3K86_19455 [Photobacterium jeanii]PST90663.1 hypothetical protein C9I91_08555 [Photobacterium jeanii]